MDKILAVYKKVGFNITNIYCGNYFHKVIDPFLAKKISGNKNELCSSTRTCSTIWTKWPRYSIKRPISITKIPIHVYNLYFSEIFCYGINKEVFTKQTWCVKVFQLGLGLGLELGLVLGLGQQKLDYERHCRYQIGEYVKAHKETQHKNKNATRSLDWIYLRTLDNAQGGHALLHLQTNKVIKRQNLTKILITSS